MPSILVWMVGRQTALAFESEPDGATEQDDEEERVSGQLEELLINVDGVDDSEDEDEAADEPDLQRSSTVQ